MYVTLLRQPSLRIARGIYTTGRVPGPIHGGYQKLAIFSNVCKFFHRGL